ncbi:glycosyltransferase [Fulvivirga ulvae]|uniref:glycosyltransferase family 2 protein n=1 Tax=Fulvivirga ulvae TaxID=2904245 RepID=UPI001F2F946A|nr:glycosyltransferase family 2 protein [Fulvivirga ulvae]UII31651.1 glycosyltransferase [Fulvivirga ulvae]
MGNSSTPNISVVIPVKNRKESLLRAIESVKKQTLRPDEIIVVDDGSAENVKDILAKKHADVMVLRNEKSMGAPYSRNRGWKAASSELISFLDSDDEMKPSNLLHKVELMVDQDCDLVLGSFELNENGTSHIQKFKVDNNRTLRDHLLLNSLFDARTSTFVVKKEVLEKIAFDEYLKKHQDWDLFINIDSSYKVMFSNDCDVILHISSNDRISSKLQHDSTEYFIDKNKNKVSDDAMYMFILKMLYKSQIRNDKYGVKLYRSKLFTYAGKVSLRYEFILFLIRYKLLNVSLLQKLKTMLKAWL